MTNDPGGSLYWRRSQAFWEASISGSWAWEGAKHTKKTQQKILSSSLIRKLKISLLGGWLGRRAQQRHNWILWRIWGKVWRRLDQENLRNTWVILLKYILLWKIGSRKFEKYLCYLTTVHLTKEVWIKKIWEVLGLSYQSNAGMRITNGL